LTSITSYAAYNMLQNFAQWDALAVGHRDITGCTVQAAVQDDRDI